VSGCAAFQERVSCNRSLDAQENFPAVHPEQHKPKHQQDGRTVRERFTGVAENLESARTEMRLEMFKTKASNKWAMQYAAIEFTPMTTNGKAHNLKPKASMVA